jgi:hypothetical protein
VALLLGQLLRSALDLLLEVGALLDGALDPVADLGRRTGSFVDWPRFRPVDAARRRPRGRR